MLDDARRPVDMSDEQLEDTVVTSDEQPRDMLIRYMKAATYQQWIGMYLSYQMGDVKAENIRTLSENHLAVCHVKQYCRHAE